MSSTRLIALGSIAGAVIALGGAWDWMTAHRVRPAFLLDIDQAIEDERSCPDCIVQCKLWCPACSREECGARCAEECA